MKKLTYALTALGLTALVGFGLYASKDEAPAGSALKAAPAETGTIQSYSAILSNPLESRTLYSEISVNGDEMRAPAVTTAAPKPISKVEDICGSYIQTYKTLLSSSYDGGCEVEIKKLANYTDSIEIVNFWTTNSPALSVHAKVNLSTGLISIPAQYLYDHTNYGAMDVCLITSDGKPDRTKPIEGFVGDDGKLYITSWWCVAINTGTNKDKYVTANYSTQYEGGLNGNMVYTTQGTDSEGNPVTRDTKYKVKIEQPSKNLLIVKNFFNCGYSCEINLKRDRSCEIPQQVVYADANGVWSTIGNLVFQDGKLTGYSKIITTEKAPANDNRNIVLKNWSLLTTSYYRGHITTATITADNDFSYPTLSVSEFQGEGTEANPYKLSTLDDLILLSDKVNEVTEYNDSTPPLKSKYARIFLGKHFSIENDIDMSGYRFDPIGNKWANVFAGTVDGHNHVIKGLEVNTGANGCAGLFGICDTVSVLKNIVLENPTVTTTGSYCGGLVGWTRGEIRNCKAIKPVITNSYGVTAGGLAGIAEKMYDCSVEEAAILSLGGFGASLCGEIHAEAINCHAVDCYVEVATVGKGAPAGGLFGNIYKGHVKNCSFSGKVDGNRRQSVMTLGLISGLCTNGIVENCFATGQIYSYGSKSVLGGVIGTMSGKMSNCYMTGRTWGYSSRKSGGITGYLRPISDTTPSEVKNVFYAGSHFAETYMYNPDKEVRETFGTLDTLVMPVIENAYFDVQLTDLKSEKYRSNTAELTAASGPKGFDASNWVFTEGQYPRLKGMENSKAAQLASSALILEPGSTFKNLRLTADLHPLGDTKYYLYNNGELSQNGHYSSIENGKLLVKEDFGTDTLFVVNGKSSIYHEIKIAPKLFDGDGTAESPYLLKTKEDLIKLSQATTVKLQYFPNTYFKFANDIDLEYTPEFLGICTDANIAANKFDGIIDGDGHYLHKMKIGHIVWAEGKTPQDDKDGLGTPVTSSSSSGGDACKGYTGFVGRLGESGVVKNLNIAADCDIYGWATMGGVVAYLYGTVENCRNYADVTGLSCWIGGVVGQGLKGSMIKNCYNEGTITTGYMNAGGIVGSTSGSVENCLNAGKAEVKCISRFQGPTSTKFNDAAGIAAGATGAYFKNVVNLADIHATTSQAGGIVSRLRSTTVNSGNNDLINAFNFGTVRAADLSLKGAISGETTTTGKVENVYYDGQISLLGAAQNNAFRGMYGVSTNTLLSGVAPTPDKALAEGSDNDPFDKDLWAFESGKLPVLKQFANEKAVEFLRSTVILIPDGHTAGDLRVNARLVAPDGTTWKLEKGDVFTIEGTTLKAPETVTEVKTDVLTATNGKYSKMFILQASPEIPVKGKGTEADPYLITSTDEWNNLSEWMSVTFNDFTGKFIKLANDIDFTDKSFQAMADNGATMMNGTFDGNGHTVKGINISAKATYKGAFGIVGPTGEIKNLTLEGKATSTINYLGGFCGKLYGKLTNCVNRINVELPTNRTYAGGFAAMAYAGSKFEKCVNEASLKAGGYMGGFIASSEAGISFKDCENKGAVTIIGTSPNAGGFAGQCYPATFENCKNSGDVLSGEDGSKSSQVGGFIGYANAAKNAAAFEFKNCQNSGTVMAKNAVAGFVGFVNKTAGTTVLHFTDCVNSGDITATVTGNPAAGIAAFYTPGSQFINCTNEGTITNLKGVYCAGITGNYSTSPTAALPALVKDCLNTGEIHADGNQGAGIIASIAAYTTVENCGNTATVSAPTMAGGICSGLNNVSGKILNCWNIGDVTVKSSRAGGIIGYNSSKATVTNCWNAGNIISTSTQQSVNATQGANQIGGIAGSGASVFTNCYNVGKVKGLAQVGGLIGLSSKNNTTVVNCYQAGEIDAPVDSCGHIIGNSLINNGRYWTENNSVTNTYYVTDYIEIDAAKRGEAGTAITTAELATKDLGEGWTAGDNYSLPVLSLFADHDGAKLHSAMVIPAAGDTKKAITKAFNVGAPQGVSWSADVDAIAFEGNRAYFTREYKGDAMLTATLGKYSKKVLITCDAAKSGIGSIDSEGKTIISEIWYTVSGVQVEKPQNADSQVYVVVTTYDDGTSSIVKKVNK